MKALDYPKKNYVYKIFATLIFMLLSGFRSRDSIVIDQEYPGHEESIKGMLINLFRKQERTVPEIHFDHIGKSSRAHKVALEVFRGNREADLLVSATDVLAVLC